MTARGVFFAITSDQAAQLRDAQDDDALTETLDQIEEAWDENNLAECDKAWDALHRLLTDGLLGFGNGAEPWRWVVLGPDELYQGDDYIVSLVPPTKVREVADALAEVTRPWFDDRYRTVVPHDYAPEYGNDDRDYTWDNFLGVRDLYQAAAAQHRYVVFTVDQ